LDALHRDAKAIFAQALEDCDIARAFDRHLHFEGTTLVQHPSPVLKPTRQPLEGYKKILVIAFGKGAEPMLEALMERLPASIRGKRVEGVCSGKSEPARRHKHIRYYQGGHPLPNEDSFAAARTALELLRRAGKDTFVFFLISGGGSAMLELPADGGISLEDARAFHETLVSCGATITEINTVRKYFSAIKGGRLAEAARDAEKLSLLLADVPLKDLAVVASSPTLPDLSTFADCSHLLERFHLLEKFPGSVREYFLALGRNPPAPRTAEALGHTQFDTLLSNHDFVNAARDRARALGYKVIIDNSCDNWSYTEASAYLLERFHGLRRDLPKFCLLSSGEVTVAIDRRPGCGGRNQQFVLEAALDLDRHKGEALAVFSAGSDGLDGNSPAAGAAADPTTVERARAFRFDPEQSLAQFNCCPVFTALGDAIMTGPTNNNLRDLRILLASSAGEGSQ
jgi:hydroxypyruvate reductase